MGDCKDESKSKSECCQTKSCCDSGHNEAHAWMASRISHLEKRATSTRRWLGIVTVLLLCLASFALGRCNANREGPQAGAMKRGGSPMGGVNASGPQVFEFEVGGPGCHGGGPGGHGGGPGGHGGGPGGHGGGPGGHGGPDSGYIFSSADVQVQGKAIIVGPDGQTREIDLSRELQGIDIGELIKLGGKSIEVKVEREESADKENNTP